MVDALGRRIAIVGVVVDGFSIATEGLNWQNGTDFTMGVVSFVPGFGWVVGALYYIADPIVKKTTGKGIGEHAGEAVDMTIKVSNTLTDKFTAGLANLESYLRSLRPR